MVSLMNEEIMKAIDEAFRLISSIYVRQNDVEIMAMAKAKLRAAYAAAEVLGKEEGDGQTD